MKPALKTFAVIFLPVNRQHGEIFGGTIKARTKLEAKAVINASGRTANYRSFELREVAP